MINTFEKAREIGALTLDRVNDYVELVRVELAIAQQRLARRTASQALMWAGVLMCAGFVGLAVIVTCWDSPYRIVAAWAVAALWLLFVLVCYLRGRATLRSFGQPSQIRHALQQDIAFLKELL